MPQSPGLPLRIISCSNSDQNFPSGSTRLLLLKNSEPVGDGMVMLAGVPWPARAREFGRGGGMGKEE